MVRLTCSWVHGNPPTAVRLLHSNRQQMMTEISDSSKNNLTYDLNQVTCDHMGVFTCQAAGAEVNRSVTLLVQCESGSFSYVMTGVAGWYCLRRG